MAFAVRDRKATIALLQQDLQTCSPEERKQKIHSIRLLYALEKFHEKSYSQAMTEFLRLDADPAEVIKLFPQLHRYTGKKWRFIKEKQHEISYLISYLNKLKTILQDKLTEIKDEGGDADDAERESLQKRLEIVNTTLLKWYLLTNNDELLFHIKRNDCDLEVSEKVLRRHGKQHELLILYKKKGLHKKALEQLKAEAKKQMHIHRFADIKNYISDLGAEHINEIIRTADWILKMDPCEAFSIFIEDVIDAKNLPRTKIFEYLIKESKPLARLYLEHVIHKWEDTNPVFHEALIYLYIEQIIALKTDGVDKEREDIKCKLLNFLEKSSYYDPNKIYLPKDGFLEEKAILYGKLGKYEDGLDIYVFILEDVEKAVAYCEKMYDANNDSARNIYLKLVQLLLKKLKQGESDTLDMDLVYSVLENNADRISAIDVLPEFSDSIPLHRLKNFLIYSLEAQYATKQQMQIYKSVTKVACLKELEFIRRAESQSFEVTDKMICSICKKPFGNQKRQAPFVRYSDGEIVHILCSSLKKEKIKVATTQIQH